MTVKRISGFTIIELIITVAIGGAVLAGLIAWWQSETRLEARDRIATIHADEMSTVARAAQRYVYGEGETAGQIDTWTNGNHYNIPINTLITAGLLPTNFGHRTSVNGQSPLLQTWDIDAYKIDDEHAPIVISERGTPNTGAMARYGMENTDAELTAYKYKVMELARERHKVVGGIVPAGSMTVEGGFKSYQKSLTNWVETNFANPSIALLVEFPDLNTTPVPSNNLEDATSTGPQWGNCRFVLNPSSQSVANDKVCNDFVAADGVTHYEEAGRWRHCQAARMDVSNPDTIISTDAGEILLSMEERHYDVRDGCYNEDVPFLAPCAQNNQRLAFLERTPSDPDDDVENDDDLTNNCASKAYRGSADSDPESRFCSGSQTGDTTFTHFSRVLYQHAYIGKQKVFSYHCESYQPIWYQINTTGGSLQYFRYNQSRRPITSGTAVGAYDYLCCLPRDAS